MIRLFSYVVDHDEGFAPHPNGRYCTLAWCKYKRKRRSPRNIVELAKKGDWVVGTGGTSRKSAGRGKLIYAMRVDNKMPLAEYRKVKRFANRLDAVRDPVRMDQYVLISEHFFYFGAGAKSIPPRFRSYPLETKRGFRYKNFTDDFISDFVAWLEGESKVGVNGKPCKPVPDFSTSRCPTTARRKVCP